PVALEGARSDRALAGRRDDCCRRWDVKWLPMLALIASAMGCKVSPLVYQCSSDTQCSGSGGRCIIGSCAFPSTSCPTGLAFDNSAASSRGGQCVSSDQLMGIDDADMAMSDSDMGEPDDIAL